MVTHGPWQHYQCCQSRAEGNGIPRGGKEKNYVGKNPFLREFLFVGKCEVWVWNTSTCWRLHCLPMVLWGAEGNFREWVQWKAGRQLEALPLLELLGIQPLLSFSFTSQASGGGLPAPSWSPVIVHCGQKTLKLWVQMNFSSFRSFHLFTSFFLFCFMWFMCVLWGLHVRMSVEPRGCLGQLLHGCENSKLRSSCLCRKHCKGCYLLSPLSPLNCSLR